MAGNVVYVVSSCFDGMEDPDLELQIIGVFFDLEKAINVFESEINSIRPADEEEEENFEDNRYIYEDGEIVYEITHFTEDYHAVIKLNKMIIE